MVLWALVGAIVAAGFLTGFTVGHLFVEDPSRTATQAIKRELRRRPAFWRARLDPAAATGLALSIAVVCVVAFGAIAGVLAYMVRTNSGLVNGDRSIAAWAATHVSAASTDSLRLITQLGATATVVTLTIIVAVIEYRRTPGRSVPSFLVLVLVGQALVVNLIKAIVDRARPVVGPGGLFWGGSFPSGHSAAAAACYASFALLSGRRRSPRARAIIDGVAVAAAVAVACSRVLLRVHWFSDVLAGLAIGWGWFVLCSIAFGGRLLRFGAPVEEAKV